MKRCFKCNKDKKLSEFYQHKQMADGYLGKCKECAKRDATEHRNKNIGKVREYDRWRAKLPHRKKLAAEVRKKYRNEHPLRNRQGLKLKRAIENGTIIKPNSCEICGIQGRPNGHHKDYSKPLEVVWVCQPCHKQLHKTQKIIG